MFHPLLPRSFSSKSWWSFFVRLILFLLSLDSAQLIWHQILPYLSYIGGEFFFPTWFKQITLLALSSFSFTPYKGRWSDSPNGYLGKNKLGTLDSAPPFFLQGGELPSGKVSFPLILYAIIWVDSLGPQRGLSQPVWPVLNSGVPNQYSKYTLPSNLAFTSNKGDIRDLPTNYFILSLNFFSELGRVRGVSLLWFSSKTPASFIYVIIHILIRWL